jgi:hypothetical protein
MGNQKGSFQAELYKNWAGPQEPQYCWVEGTQRKEIYRGHLLSSPGEPEGNPTSASIPRPVTKYPIWLWSGFSPS